MGVGATTFEFLHAYIDQLPRAPLHAPLSDRAALKYQMCMLVIGSLRSAREIAFSASKLWLQGHFLLATVGVRMLTELYGQMAWAQAKVLGPIQRNEIALSSERMAKLLLGSNSAIPLIRGESGPHPLINVMDFVRAADTKIPEMSDHYAFLCDSAHPSYMLQSWLLFAGPDHDNWTNATFATEVSKILERVVQIAELSVAGIAVVSEELMSQCVPEIVAEAAAWRPADTS